MVSPEKAKIKKPEDPMNITDSDLLDMSTLDKLLKAEGMPIEYIDVPEAEEVYAENAQKAVADILRTVNDHVEKSVMLGLPEKDKIALKNILRPTLYGYENGSASQWRPYMLGLLKDNKIDEFNQFVETVKKKNCDEIEKIAGEYLAKNSTTH